MIETFGNFSAFRYCRKLHWNAEIFQAIGLMWKIVAKFHFLSLYDNITVKQPINNGAIQEVCHFNNCIFYFIHLCHAVSVLLFIIPNVLLTKNNKLWNDRKEDFLCIWLFLRITLYQGRQKVASLDRMAFLDTYVCINNPYQQSSVVIIFLCKCYIVTSDILMALGCDFLLLAVILSELREKPRSGDWATKQSTQKNLLEEHHFFCFLLCHFHFLSLFLSTPSASFTPIFQRILMEHNINLSQNYDMKIVLLYLCPMYIWY